MQSAAGSVVKYLPFLKKKKAYNVLDYGAGKLRNANYLSRHGFKVYATDLPEQLKRVQNLTVNQQHVHLMETDDLHNSKLNVDLVISTFVLNIIADPVERKRYLDNIALNLRPGGYLLIEVKCRGRLSAEGCSCPLFPRCPQCDKSYSREELDQLVNPYGFKRLGHFYGRYSVAVLYKSITTTD